MRHEDETPFRFDVEIEAFEKGDGEPEKARRIGGFVSTAKLDKQGERVLQEGLDFRPFVEGGWFNDNHSKATADIVGFPEDARLVRKGEKLPTGKAADKTGWWVEGYLLQGHPPADKLWHLAKALHGTKRRLGYSIEGRVTQRINKAGEPVVAAAVVKNVALTNCPVNTDTALEVLTKSLDAMNKALSAGPAAGPASDPGLVPAGEPLTGAGAGRVLAPESLDGARPKKRKKRRLTKSEAFDLVRERYPRVSTTTAARILAYAAQHASQSRAA